MSMASPFLLVCLVASLASLSPRVLAQPVCVQPDGSVLPSDTSPSDSGHVLVTTDADEARNTALCHVACMNLLYANGTNDTDGTIDTDGIVGFFQLDCNKFAPYLDCRYGCVLESQGQSNCASTCSGRCREELMCNAKDCFGSQVENNDCGVSCKADDCDRGCQQFMLFTDLNPPMNPPELIRVDIATQNIYTVDIPDDHELMMFSNPSLVFRIEAQSLPGDYVYQWMVDVEFDLPTVNLMEFTLDLTSYSGQSVNVAYAFATDVGLSQYSEATVIEVPEICIVSELSDSEVDVSVTLDERAGFFTHSVLNVSWCPSNCPDQVSHYVVTSTPVNNARRYCGETLTEIVNASSSSVLLQSSNPRSLELHCNYEVEVQVVLGDTTHEVSKFVILPNIQENDVPLLDILGCPVTYRRSENSYEVDFQWRAPFSAAALSHINRFVIRGDARERGPINNPVVQVGVFRENVPVNLDPSHAYSYKRLLTPFEVTRQFYLLSVEVAWEDPPGPARSDNCRTVYTPAPPPFPINDITIRSRDTEPITETDGRGDVTVTVSFQWKEPTLNYTNAAITGYESHLGLQRLEPKAMGSDISSYNGNARQGSIFRIFTNLDVRNDSFIAYLQMRSYQFDTLPSDWSDPVPVEFVLLKKPTPVEGIRVDFNDVQVVYAVTPDCMSPPCVKIFARVRWTAIQLRGQAVLERYNLIINNKESFNPVETNVITVESQFRLPPPVNKISTLALNFQVTSTVSLENEMETSDPNITQAIIQSLPLPENIIVKGTNPRITQTDTGGAFDFSVELFVDWEHPSFQVNFTEYEVYFHSGNDSLRPYDLFVEDEDVNVVDIRRERILSVTGNTTELRHNFMDSFSKRETPIFVQIRPRVEINTLLPQWSAPVAISFSTQPPPEVTSTELMSTELTPGLNSGEFRIDVTVAVSWAESAQEQSGEVDHYQLWIGRRQLGEFEEPDDDAISGSVFQFEANFTTSATESFQFSSISDSVAVFIQMRSIGPDRIPIWSSPIVLHTPVYVLPKGSSPSDSGHVLVTTDADEARNTALCHVACINLLYANGTNDTDGTVGFFQLDCRQQFRTYLDCRYGCVLESQGQSNCASTCSGRCQEELMCEAKSCFGSQVENNDCGVDCDADDCRQGCQQFMLFTDLDPPMNPPELIRVDIATQNIYTVDIPDDHELMMFSNPSLVFRIEVQSLPGDYVYQWMVDVEFDLSTVNLMEFTLDLTSYSGQNVNVAYAFATDVGLSQYSEDTVIEVPEIICIVSELSDSEVDVRFTPDERTGFFTHSVLNVSWCPSNCPDQVSHYVVTSTPVNNPGRYCGETLTETVNAFSSSVLLQSSNPRSLELPCNYEVEVQVVLGDTTQEVSKPVILPNIQENDVPLLDMLGCPVTYRRSENKYEVDFQWRAPFSAAALSHINRFVIRGDALQRGPINNPAVQVGVFRDFVAVNLDSSHVYSYKRLLTPFEVTRQFYLLSVEVAWNDPPGPARSDNCRTVDTPAPPPFPITNHNITILARDALDIMQTEDITIIAIVIVRFEWEEPELNYTLAPITQYQAHLALQPLLPDAEGNEIVSYNGNARLGSIIRTFTNLDISKDSFTAYLQIRSFQFDSLPSRWSAAQAINISLQHFECNARRDSQFAVIIDCVPNPISARTQCSFAGGPFHPCTLPLVVTEKVSPQGFHSLSVISSLGAEPFTLSYVVVRTRSPDSTSPNVPPLGVYLVNDSPLVSSNGNGSVQAEFQLTRPVKSVRCSLRSLFGRVNQHCSSQKVTFSGLQPGFYILRIHAHNSKADKITVRRGVVVTSDPTFCSLVLINRGVVLGEDGSSATVEFKAHGPPVQHSCVLDNGEIFDCASPVVLASLDSGRHKLRIIPRGCVERFKSLYVSFTIL